MAQFVLMHPATRGGRAHTKRLLTLPSLNLCSFLAQMCKQEGQMLVAWMWAFSFAQLCKGAYPENFSVKCWRLLVAQWDLLQGVAPAEKNQCWRCRCTTFMWFFIYFSFSCLCPHSSQVGLLHKFVLLQRRALLEARPPWVWANRRDGTFGPICAMEQSGSICATPKTFQWKADLLLLHRGCELLQER